MLGPWTPVAFAAEHSIEETTILSVNVNGGSDTANPGTSCIRVTSTTPAICTNRWIAIPNNNKPLLAAALTAKATGSKVWVYFSDGGATQHCPGQAFTTCALISIDSR